MNVLPRSLSEMVASLGTAVSSGRMDAPTMPGAFNPTGESLKPSALSKVGGVLQKLAPAILSAIALKQGGTQAAGAMLEGYSQQLARKRQQDEEREERELARIEKDEQRSLRRQELTMAKYRAVSEKVEQALENADPSWDEAEIASYIADADELMARVYGVPPGFARSQMSSLGRRVNAAQQKAAEATVSKLRTQYGDEQFDQLVTSGVSIPFLGKTRPIQQVLKLAQFPTQAVPIPIGVRGGVSDVGAVRPVLPSPKRDELQFPNSDEGIDLRIEIAAEAERLGRKLRPSEVREVRARLKREAEAQALRVRAVARPSARSSSGSSSAARPAAPPKNPRGTNAIPQGVESYLLSMRNRGYTQADALAEALREDVWQRLAGAHPSLTAERVREAIIRLVPEEGFVAPVSEGPGSGAAEPERIARPAGARGAGPGAASAPASRGTMTLDELRTMAESFGISEDEARRVYEARGFTIR